MTLHRMDVVGSTNDEARILAAAGAAHGTAVLARQQDAGRGRQGRVWASPPGNLHLSVVLRPGVALRQVPQIGLVAALAVADAADALLGRAAATLKWPNDVMLDGAKAAGLLLEMAENGAAILGIGMNLAHAPPGLPYAVTCLSRHGVAAEPEQAAAAVLAGLDAWWGQWQRSGLPPILAAWMRRGPAAGTVLRVRQGAGWRDGQYAGLDEDGALLLDGPAGRERVVAGEVQ